MKLKEFLKNYYNVKNRNVTMGSEEIRKAWKELVLPGSFGNMKEFRKVLSWNLDREAYYRDVIRYVDIDPENLYATITTGRIDFHCIFDDESDFKELITSGLKKFRTYRKENLPSVLGENYLYYSRHYE